MTAVLTERPSARTLIADSLFERLVTRIAAEKQLNRKLASRIMEQARVPRRVRP